MIVKNESKVIERCLDSVKHFVDYFVICDTGSTDGTQDIVFDYLKRNELAGELHQHEWVHFGHNRTLSFEAAKGKCDYIMTIDADEVFVPYAGGLAQLDQTVNSVEGLVGDIVYLTSHFSSLRYLRPQFFNDERDWMWDQAVHEVPVCLDKESPANSYMNNCCIYVRQEGNRSEDPPAIKFGKDAKILEKWMKDHPKDARAAFYLCQSYADAGNHKKALAKIPQALKLTAENHPKEYILRLRKARWSAFTGADNEKLTNLLLEAMRCNPERPEAASDLVTLYFAQNDWHSVVAYGQNYIHYDEVPPATLFGEARAWTWYMKYMVGEAYLELGQPELCLQLSHEALDRWWNVMSEEHEARLRNNIKRAEAAL